MYLILNKLHWFLKAQKLGLCLCVGTCWHEWDLGLATPCETTLNVLTFYKLHTIEGTCNNGNEPLMEGFIPN